jgi:hypothetical protein
VNSKLADKLEAAAPVVFLCSGKHCKAEGKPLARSLTDAGVTVEAVDCQKICEGPVAGCALDGRLVWFEDMDGHKAAPAFVSMLTTTDGSPHLDRLPSSLRKRVVSRRTNRLRD